MDGSHGRGRIKLVMGRIGPINVQRQDGINETPLHPVLRCMLRWSTK